MGEVCVRAAIAASVLLTYASASVAESQDYPKMHLKYASHVPGNNVVSDVDKFFAEEITKRSGGNIQVDFFWNRAIGKVTEMLPLIEAGGVDITTLEPPQYTELQLSSFLATPWVFNDAKQIVELGQYLYEQDTPIRDELASIGAMNIFTRHLPQYKLLCTKPIRTMADFRGAKLRGYGAYVPLMWQAVDAIPVNVIASDLYEGLSKGVFDCAYLPPPFLKDYKLYEPAKYLSDIDFGMIIFGPQLVPRVIWDQWPESVQKLVKDVARDTQEYSLTHIEENNQSAIDYMVQNGVQIVPFEDKVALKAVIPDMVDVWLEKQKEAGRGEAAAKIVQIARQKFGIEQ